MPPPDDDRPSSPDPPTAALSAAATGASVVPPELLVGQVLAQRYRVVRFIARGGMGAVYAAEDQELGETVALKTIRPGVAGSPQAMQLFLREVQLARKVSHVNVCRTFDVFHHALEPPPGWAGPPPEITFLTMELLPGETLSARLGREGPLATAEALPLVRQVAAGLAAAHEAGVVHWDLKSSNIVLVPGARGARAVVTDFGLARAADTDRESSATDGGLVAGTPAYMAPEQVEGREASPASDVYALGVVMYEMVTGKRPLEGDSPFTTARLRLNTRPASPRSHVADLPPVWEKTILRCLERDPERRFASVLDVVRALEGEAVLARSPRAQRARRALAAGAALLLALVAAWLLLRPPGRDAPEPRRSVAVLGFKNLSGRADEAWISTALAEMLTSELAAGEKLRMIPGESVARTRIELSLPEADAFARDTLARLRVNLGADLVLLGSYYAAGKDAGGRLRVELRLQDTALGETVASTSETGTDAELLDLVARAGARVRTLLGAGTMSAAEQGSLRASLPASAVAARPYAEGLDRLRLFDALAARDALAQAVQADPAFPLAHSALAQAWSVLGYDGRAREEARRAFDLSGRLPREERLFVTGRHHEAAQEWQQAIETYRALRAFFPDNLDYGLRLAAAQTAAGQGTEALLTLDSLRDLPPPASQDPRIDLAEAEAADSLSDFRKAQAAAARATEKGQALGARLLVARARFLSGRALFRLGDLADAATAAQASRLTFAEVGDRGGVARALHLYGVVVDDQGDLARALSTYQEVLAIAREIGNRSSASAALNSIGLVHWQQGDLARARARFEEALAIDREIGDRLAAARRMNNIADTLRRSGDLAAARTMTTDSLGIRREIGDRLGIANCLRDLASALWLQGDLQGARGHAQESLEILRAIGNVTYQAESQRVLGDVLLAQGDLASARRSYESALALMTQMGHKAGTAAARVALAGLALEAGRPGQAEAAARPAVEEFERERRADEAAWARHVLARCLLAQGRTDEAGRALAPALARSTQSLDLQLALAITAARLRAAAGRSAEALTGLEAARQRAQQAGYVGLELEARLWLGTTELSSGRAQAGRARLQALQREAHERGFGLVARQAAGADRRDPGAPL